jgi:hypothetical protein
VRHAGDRAAIELNLSGFQNPMTGGTTMFHNVFLSKTALK